MGESTIAILTVENPVIDLFNFITTDGAGMT